MRDDDLSEEANSLIQGYVEGVLTPAECRRLRELIRRDPRLARLVAESVRMEDEIRDVLPRRVVRRTSRRLRSRYRPADRPSAAWITTASVAAAGILLFLALAVQAGTRSPIPVARNSLEKIPHSEPLKPEGSKNPPRQDEPSANRPPPSNRPVEAPPPLIPRISDLPKPIEQPRPPSVEEPREAPKPATTVADNRPQKRFSVGRVEEATDAVLVFEGTRTPIVGSCELYAGQTLETGSAGRALLIYPDQTCVELNPGTTVSDVRAKNGKELRIDQGAIRAVVSKQSSGNSMVFVTPHGTAKVLGTVLRIAVTPGIKGSTLLQVTEGKVRLTNRAKRSIEVEGGFQGVASDVPDLVKETMNAEGVLKYLGKVTISFGPVGRALPEGCAIDSGLLFDFDRGHGWEQSIGSNRFNKPDRDYLKNTYVAGGTAKDTLSWKMRMPKGTYRVTVGVGGAAQDIPDQGPHHVVVQGTTIVNALMTLNGEFEARSGYVNVTNGILTLSVGGHRSDKRTPTDNDDDTILNYITIEWVPR